tara:strand:- start:982 stop:1746 length:765 start_codon:yes stop_codon:yes gene_type:complete
MKDLVLFDMDGTLTEPRERIKESMIEAVDYLIGTGAEIGIVTGSDTKYILEQINDQIIYFFKLYPCNGTKVYDANNKIYTYKNDMNNKIGKDGVKQMISLLLKLQLEMVEKHDVPLSGHFVDLRGSMINWCPIGRSASKTQRNKFVEIDHMNKIRESMLPILKDEIFKISEEITCVLGGSTSFDIYPNGWDKTYVLKHCKGKRVWFVGDKCTGNGNDRALYEEIDKTGRAYQTSSPKQTISIIDEIIGRIECGQ